MSSKLEYFMKQAIDLAQKAYNLNDIPIGAVVVKNEKIIGKGYNQVKLLNDPTAHAEIIAIRKACKKLKTTKLTGFTRKRFKLFDNLVCSESYVDSSQFQQTI